MEVIRGLYNLKARHKGSVVTIGNFDGVHQGHQTILTRVRDAARELGRPSMLICFEPQPREFFDAFNAPARLTRFREKVQLLDEHGIDYVLCFKFDEQTRSMPAARFIEILVSDIEVGALFVGDDFRFGHDRSGNFSQLAAAGKEYGFAVTNQWTLSVDDHRVSSTRIRQLLADGDFEGAEKLLGRPYAITGKVIYGRQLGRTLGTPTANIQLHRYRAPIDGVYAVEAVGLDSVYQGVANVGVRPTVDADLEAPILEVHLFDFEGNIYGRCIDIVFRHKIREEKKFGGLEELKAAIAGDIAVARQYFGARLAAG